MNQTPKELVKRKKNIVLLAFSRKFARTNSDWIFLQFLYTICTISNCDISSCKVENTFDELFRLRIISDLLLQKEKRNVSTIFFPHTRMTRTVPCVAALMSSLTVITIAMDRFRFIVSPHKSQVNKWMENFNRKWKI